MRCLHDKNNTPPRRPFFKLEIIHGGVIYKARTTACQHGVPTICDQCHALFNAVERRFCTKFQAIEFSAENTQLFVYGQSQGAVLLNCVATRLAIINCVKLYASRAVNNNTTR